MKGLAPAYKHKITLAIHTHSNSMKPSIKLGFPENWEIPGYQNISCFPFPNAEFTSFAEQVPTIILFGCGTFCHAVYDCSSGNIITSLVHSLEFDSSY